MRKKRKPHKKRTVEDVMEVAAEAMELANVLARQGGISDQNALERMARSNELADHDGETCGQCHNMILGAQVAGEMIERGEYEDVVSKWAAETKRRWENSKFFKLWEKEKEAGRDPRKAFKIWGGNRDRPMNVTGKSLTTTCLTNPILHGSESNGRTAKEGLPLLALSGNARYPRYCVDAIWNLSLSKSILSAHCCPAGSPSRCHRQLGWVQLAILQAFSWVFEEKREFSGRLMVSGGS